MGCTFTKCRSRRPQQDAPTSALTSTPQPVLLASAPQPLLLASAPVQLQSADAGAIAAIVARTEQKDLTHVKTNDTVPTTTAKIQLELRKKPDLDRVEAPQSGLTDAQKQAYREEKKEKKR